MFNKKKYLYAIAFWATDKDGRSSTGCAQITRTRKINTISDFNETMSTIYSNNTQLANVVICNIMLLGKVKA
jgi:hypothetical protein